jgi:hypothetical protein
MFPALKTRRGSARRLIGPHLARQPNDDIPIVVRQPAHPRGVSIGAELIEARLNRRPADAKRQRRHQSLAARLS